MEPRRIVDATDAWTCLEAAEQSGQTRADWARSNGICWRSLQGWWLTLVARHHKQTDADLRLVELFPTENPVRPPSTYVIRCRGLAVELDEHFQPEVLRRLLAVVEGC